MNRGGQKSTGGRGGGLLSEESARVLAAYHRLKRAEASRVAEGDILKVIDVADEARMKQLGSEEDAGRRTGQTERKRRLNTAHPSGQGRAAVACPAFKAGHE
ncbi:hypothetical protein M3Y99_01858600 [Aphelenchoides fujianensis]|nr:hypothetical protein M3Y99_01858600 [Aphelenchoides fujianensis]